MQVPSSLQHEFRQKVFHKKFRWIAAFYKNKTELWVPAIAKVDARPDCKVEETELNYLSSKTWIPGKHLWQQIGITITHSPEWLPHADFNRVVLGLFDGCGNQIEEWDLQDCQCVYITNEPAEWEQEHSNIRLKYTECIYRNRFDPIKNQVTIE